jgi:flagellar biosynthesis GTPase FlhF
MGFFERASENYLAQRRGRAEAREEQYKKSPTATTVGTVAGLGVDLAIPTPKSATATGALFGLGSSEKSLLEDPQEALTQTAVGAGLGYGLGKAGRAIQKVSEERQALRAFSKAEKEATNAYEKALAKHQEEKRSAQEAFNIAQRDAAAADAAAQQRYQQNMKLYEKQESQAQKSYQEAQEEFQRMMVEKLGRLEKDLPYGIQKGTIEADEFIAQNVQVSSEAGSRQAKEVSGFIQEVTQGLPEKLEAKDISRLFEAIEGRLVEASEFERGVLQRFKEHLVDRLPAGAAQNRLASKVAPRIQKNATRLVSKELDRVPKRVVNELESRVLGKGGWNQWRSEIENAVAERIQNLSPAELSEALQKGDTNIITSVLRENPQFVEMTNMAETIGGFTSRGLGQLGFEGAQARTLSSNLLASELSPLLAEAETRIAELPALLERNLDPVMRRAAIDANVFAVDAEKLQNRLSNAVGVRSPSTGRLPTNQPPQPFVSGKAPEKPIAGAPVAKPYVGEPPLPPPPSLPPEVGYLAERFESQPMNPFQKGGMALGTMGVGKMFGLPGVGKIVAGGMGAKAALEGTLRGITSPAALPSAARRVIGRNGIQVVVREIAMDYPSYQNGVIQDPMERREAVAQLENDTEIPIENKSVIQAYINRGKNLEKFIRGE